MKRCHCGFVANSRVEINRDLKEAGGNYSGESIKTLTYCAQLLEL